MWNSSDIPHMHDRGEQNVKLCARPCISHLRLSARPCQEHAGPAPKGMKRPATRWVRPGLIGRVKHLRGEEGLRHASLQEFREIEPYS